MGLTNDLEEIKGWIKEQREKEVLKEKKWKFPFGKKVGKGQRKKNYVTTLLLNENGTYDFKKYQIEDQTIVHETIPRLASAGYVMFNKKGNPLLILPNWSVEPFSPIKNFKDSLADGSNTVGYRLLMARMHSTITESKKKMSGILKWIIGFVIAGVVGYALLTGGGN